MSEINGKVDEDKSRHHNWIEIIAASLLALATVASAWSAYQSSRWHGKQAIRLAKSNATRIHSSEKYDAAFQQTTMDAAVFSDYVLAYSQEDMRLVTFYENNVFRPEMRVAVDAWKASRPFQNPDAPRSPFEMEEYRNADLEEARSLEKEANKYTESADEAIQNADRYVLLTVLFASVLFFAGISTKFGTLKIKYALLAGGIAIFIGSMALLLSQPFA